MLLLHIYMVPVEWAVDCIHSMLKNDMHTVHLANVRKKPQYRLLDYLFLGTRPFS